MNNNKSNPPQNYSNISLHEGIINVAHRIEASDDTMDVEPFTSRPNESSRSPSPSSHVEVFDNQNLYQSCNTEADDNFIEQSDHLIKSTISIKEENTDEICDGHFSDDPIGFLREIRLGRTKQSPVEINGTDNASFPISNQELWIPIDIFSLNTENRQRSVVSEISRQNLPPTPSSQISSTCSISKADQNHDLFKSKTRFCRFGLHPQEVSKSKDPSSDKNGNARNASMDGSSSSEKCLPETFGYQRCARATSYTLTSEFKSNAFDRSTSDGENSKKKLLTFGAGEGLVCEKESMNTIGEELAAASDCQRKKLLRMLEHAILICDLPKIDHRL